MVTAKPQGPAEILREEFLDRRRLNANYSLRSFAIKIGIPSGRLSEILSGKRAMTLEIAKKVSQALNFSDKKSSRFLSSLEVERMFGSSGAFRKRNPRSARRVLKEDQFAFVREWYHTAILSLLETDDFQSDPAWIASRLGLLSAEVIAALERLKRLGLVTHQEDGSLRAASSFCTTEDVSSSALRESHRQTLMQAVEALETIPIELREITTVSLCTSLDKIEMAKAAIRRFRDELANLMESGPKTEVYNLNIQLMPVTRLRRKI